VTRGTTQNTTRALWIILNFSFEDSRPFSPTSKCPSPLHRETDKNLPLLAHLPHFSLLRDHRNADTPCVKKMWQVWRVLGWFLVRHKDMDSDFSFLCCSFAPHFSSPAAFGISLILVAPCVGRSVGFVWAEVEWNIQSSAPEVPKIELFT